MMSLPFLAAKLSLGSSIAVNYNEQSKIRQVTISKSSQWSDVQLCKQLRAHSIRPVRGTQSTIVNTSDHRYLGHSIVYLEVGKTDNGCQTV